MKQKKPKKGMKKIQNGLIKDSMKCLESGVFQVIDLYKEQLELEDELIGYRKLCDRTMNFYYC